MQSLQDPKDQNNFSVSQEYVRKDVERCFGVLQSRWSMIAHPCRLWSTSDMADVIYACIIMHNMIIEDEAYENLLTLHAPSSFHSRLRGFTFHDLQVSTSNLQDLETYCVLRDDLVQYLSNKKSVH